MNNPKYEEGTIYRVSTEGSDDSIKEALEELGFYEIPGVMAMYGETYVDVIKLGEIIEENRTENSESDDNAEAIAYLTDLVEEIGDGTICFYNAA